MRYFLKKLIREIIYLVVLVFDFKACFLPITLTRPDLFSNSPSMAETKEDLPDPTVPTTCNCNCSTYVAY